MGIQYSVIKAVLSRILNQKTKRSDSACNSITTLRHVTTTKERENYEDVALNNSEYLFVIFFALVVLEFNSVKNL